MPQQKASKSFADDLAEVQQGRSFADDLAEVQPELAVSHTSGPDLSTGEGLSEFLLSQPGPLGQLARAAANGGLVSAAPGLETGKKVISGLARRWYQGLGKPSKTLREEFPDVIETALTERIPLTRGGARKVGAKLAESSRAADDVIAKASPISAPIRAREIVPEFKQTIATLRKRIDIGEPSELKAVGERGQRLMQADRGRGFDLKRSQELKKEAQDAAAAAYRQAERGAVRQGSAGELLNKDVARGFRSAIEQRVPEVAPINERTQSLMGADRMLEDFLGREGNTLAAGGMRDLIAVGAGGGMGAAVGLPAEGAGAALLLRLLAMPSVGSRGAILANDANRLGVPEKVLRLLMSSHEETPP